MSPEKTRAKHSAEKPTKKQGSFEIALPIRLGIAAVLVIISALLKMPVLVRTVLLALAVVAAGYDIFLASVDDIAAKKYFSTSIVILFAAVLGFVIGYAMEAAVMVILYQLSGILIEYTRTRAIRSAKNLISVQDEDIKSRMEEIASAKDAGETDLQFSLEKSAAFVLRFVAVLALLYALLMPFLTGISFRVSFHRALMILLVSSPMAVGVSFPVVGISGLFYCAKNGILFNSARTMEQATELNVAIFDKAGVFSEEVPHVIGIQSDVLDKKTFLNFLAHAVYYSDQPFAKAISDYYNQEYKLELINNFEEIPGSGVMLEIGHAPVILATKSYFESHDMSIPDRNSSDGIPYYMTIAGRYVGRVVISSEINQEAESLVDEMNRAGITRNILLTEDGNEQSQAAADSLHFTEVVGECDIDKKLRLISDINQAGKIKSVFIYANGIEGHSAADLDMRVSRKGKYADALVIPESYLNIPTGIQICRRMLELLRENAIFAIAVKAILIFLSFIGYSTLWFIVFIDTAAALATLLNAIRVTTPSLLGRNKEDED
ncbi:MAG: cation-translocating P-type ATPase [Oscillospiraceae bacterium]|nr:cation-translocating P-type ATPase [Oscillospiraceae bacterium]